MSPSSDSRRDGPGAADHPVTTSASLRRSPPVEPGGRRSRGAVGRKEGVVSKQRPKYTSVRVSESFAVVRPESRLVGDNETDEFMAITKQLNEDELDFIVIDLGAIDWVSSPGIGALVDAHQRFAKRGAYALIA